MLEYPYMPPDRRLKYVPHDHPFMIEAARAREERAGDPAFPVGIVFVRDGQVVVRAGNGFDRGPQTHVCPRIVLECPTGTGYDLCHLHDAEGHAEQMAVKAAGEQGVSLEGADAYMYGHWWACEPCWNALTEAGVRDLYVTDDAHERFSRDRVYAETLVPSVRRVVLRGISLELVEGLSTACTEVGCCVAEDGEAVVRQSSDGLEVFLAGGREPVYRIICDDEARACRQLKNVLRQL